MLTSGKTRKRDKPSPFPDLGKATKRGVRLCPKCSTLNGTRGTMCKNKSCDVVFRDNSGLKRKATTDACRVLTDGLPGYDQEVYSIRLRDRGPDYRNFVHISTNNIAVRGQSSILSEADQQIQQPTALPKCYVDSCGKNGAAYPCAHIKSAQNCFTTSEPILIKNTTLANLNIPYEYKETVLDMFIKGLPNQLIQRVSKTSFVVKCPISDRHPLGFLHILFYKTGPKEERNLPKFLCTCRAEKLVRSEAEAESPPTYEALSTKLCIHYYACVCAFASHRELEQEFDYFINHATSQELPQRQSQSALAEMDLISISDREPQVIEPMDENQMSAEIIRENISLLESIAAADDSSIPNGLESVLADQIIVTNVDDSLNFGDSSALDGLDDPDAQVSGHLTHISEILSQTNPNQQVICQIFTHANGLHNSFESVDDGQLSDQNDLLAVMPSSIHSQSQIIVSPQFKKRRLSPTKGSRRLGDFPEHVEDLDEYRIVEMDPSFENWLAGINERINGTMNYQLAGTPEPFVILVLQDHFDILKERITSGWKKKRLPNQTVIVHQRERPPLGVFTKHVWRITNVVHLLHIFQSSKVPLKISQFFVQNSNGGYDQWVSSTETENGSKNTPIFPVLHGTTLKIGKLEACSKDIIPFTIEWTQDVLPHSRHGELSLTFQFNHSGPIHSAEERRNSCAPLQKILQNHSLGLSKLDLSKTGISI